jgi:hypothetical protein
LGCHWPKLSRWLKMRSLARAFSSSRRAADQGVEAELVDRLQQRHRLVHIARFAGVCQAHGAARHGVFHAAHDQLGAQFLGSLVAEIGHFGKLWPVSIISKG